MEHNHTSNSGLVKISDSEEESVTSNPHILAQSFTIYKIGEYIFYIYETKELLISWVNQEKFTDFQSE